MAIDATSGQSNQGFFKKIGKGITNAAKSTGKWFNKNGGTVGKIMSAVGDTAMQTGMTLAQFEVMKNGSIWGMGCMGMGYGMPMGYGLDFYANYDPLGLSGWMGMSGSGYNPYLTQMGNQMAYNMGAATMQQLMLQNNQSQINYSQYFQNSVNVNQNIKADFAKLDVSKQDTQAGKEFDKGTDALTKDGEAIQGKTFSFGLTKSNNQKTDTANYQDKVQNVAKSYVAHIDSEYGNKDGAITLEEFKKHEMSKLGNSADDTKKAQSKQMAETAFKKLDLNGDNKLDWKEYSAAFTTFDQSSSGTDLDGVIKSEDYANWSTALGDATSTKFDKAARTNYLQLFKKQDG